MAARRADSPKSNDGKQHSKRLPASTNLEWMVRRQETHTTVVEPGLVAVVSQTVFVHSNGQVAAGAWQAVVTNSDGVPLMQASDDDRDTAFAAVGEYLEALTLARERDPQPR